MSSCSLASSSLGHLGYVSVRGIGNVRDAVTSTLRRERRGIFFRSHILDLVGMPNTYEEERGDCDVNTEQGDTIPSSIQNSSSRYHSGTCTAHLR